MAFRTVEFTIGRKIKIPVWMVITQVMIKAIRDKASFDPSMLYYAWYFNDEEPFESELWRAMMSTFETILSDTNDKERWKWLKEQFINSLIWFLPHPNNKSNEEEKEEDENEAD